MTTLANTKQTRGHDHLTLLLILCLNNYFFGLPTYRVISKNISCLVMIDFRKSHNTSSYT